MKQKARDTMDFETVVSWYNHFKIWDEFGAIFLQRCFNTTESFNQCI